MALSSPPPPPLGFAAGAQLSPPRGFALVDGPVMANGSPAAAAYAYYATGAVPLAGGSPPGSPQMASLVVGGGSPAASPLSAYFVPAEIPVALGAHSHEAHRRATMVHYPQLVHSPPAPPMLMVATGPEELDSRNVYIRNLPESCTDDMLARMAQPYGEIVSSKSIIYEPTGKCKGYGFVMYRTEAQAAAAIEAFNAMGLYSTLARDSIKAKLKRMQDRSSTNVYVSNLPPDVDEERLVELLKPYPVVSAKILRDSLTGEHKSVGFARMADRETAMIVIEKLRGMVLPNAPAPLSPRIADSADQKRLKRLVTGVLGASGAGPMPDDCSPPPMLRSGATSPVMWSPVLVYTPAGSPPALLPLPASVHGMDYMHAALDAAHAQRIPSPQLPDHHYQGYHVPPQAAYCTASGYVSPAGYAPLPLPLAHASPQSQMQPQSMPGSLRPPQMQLPEQPRIPQGSSQLCSIPQEP
ncbi:hypothetical protein LPJ61_002060, partial [Coemansia biformis]